MRLSNLDLKQWFKVVKAALYVGASALIAYLISAIAADPNLFGVLTPLINVVLVMLKQVFTEPSK